MDIPLSRYQNIPLDKLPHSCRVDSKINQGRFLFSGCTLFNTKIWRTPICQITSSLSEQVLKPRPLRRKPTIVLNEVEETSPLEETHIRSSNSSSGICGQIENLVQNGMYHEALELFEIFVLKGGYEVGGSTYHALVDACIELRSIRGIKRVCSYMINSGFEPDQKLRNSVLLTHVKCGMMIDARNLFDEMPQRNSASWNTIIGGLVDSGNHIEAFRLFLMAWEEFSDADSRAFATMIRASAGLELISLGRQLHSCALKMGMAQDIFVSCSLINMYSKCGTIEDAQSVFDEMPEKTTVGWNSIVAGYAFNGYSEEALSMYYEMQDSGVNMDHFTFSIIIRVCTRLGSLQHAKQAHAVIVRHGLGLDIVANTTLVDFYSKWGRIEDARNVFEKMPRKNVISWNALIAGYGNHGRGIEAVELFERMIREGMVPNHVTFLAVLSACSYSGLSDDGWEIFESMTRIHKIKPRAMHYACMIELLGREGFLDEALDLIRNAPFRPTMNMWAALLTACRVHKDLELGKFAAEKIYGMSPEKLGNYIVLLNIYNSKGKVEEAAAVVQNLKIKGLRMLPACTWIEIKKESHVFFSGDKSHVQTKEIYKKLHEVMQKISKHGYVSEGQSLLPDVDEHEQQISLSHSEKLAVCFGLISTSSATPLHLVQSHRICDDCHSAIKFVAMVTGREIVVRDASRFHRFKGGICSCGDYW